MVIATIIGIHYVSAIDMNAADSRFSLGPLAVSGSVLMRLLYSLMFAGVMGFALTLRFRLRSTQSAA
jgi:hypothetical protein